MEVQLLKDMIEDREQRILVVQRKLDEHAEKESRLRSELDEARQKNAEQTAKLTEERSGVESKLEAAERQLTDLSRDLAQQASSLRMYASMMDHERERASDNTAFVMRMQAQLCKGMHSLGILEKQIDLAKRQSESLVKYQRDHVAKMTEEKSQVELKLMNELMNIDLGRRDVENDLTSKLDEIRKEMEATEKQIEENRDSDDEGSQERDDEDDDDEEEEEEKEAKEELLKFLREKRDEIERIEQETEQQAETIEELEAELADLKDQASNGGSPPKSELRKQFDEALDTSDSDAPGEGGGSDEPTRDETEDDAEDDDAAYEPAEEEETDGDGDDRDETDGDAFEDATESVTSEALEEHAQ